MLSLRDEKITQARCTLSKFYNEVNPSILHSKIKMSVEQGSADMSEYANQEAVGAFITARLSNKYTRGSLYSHHSKALESTDAFASTINHDKETYNTISHRYNQLSHPTLRRYEDRVKYKPNIQAQYNHQPHHLPLEIDKSHQYVRPIQYNTQYPLRNKIQRSQQHCNPFGGDQQAERCERILSSRNKVQQLNQTECEDMQ